MLGGHFILPREIKAITEIVAAQFKELFIKLMNTEWSDIIFLNEPHLKMNEILQ